MVLRKSQSTGAIQVGGSQLGQAAFGGLLDRAKARKQNLAMDRSQAKQMERINGSIAESNDMLGMRIVQKKAFVNCEMQPVFKVEGGAAVLQTEGAVKESARGAKMVAPEVCAFSNTRFEEGSYFRYATCACKCPGHVLAIRQWSQERPMCPRGAPLLTKAELRDIFG
jgi:hypothetical protein